MAPYISLSTTPDAKPRPRLFTPARAGVAFITAILLAFFTLSSTATRPQLVMSSPSGWHSRATPYEAPYDVKKENLVFGMMQSTRVEPQGFSVAFFKPNIAIDAMGRTYEVQPQDFDALSSLAAETTSLPNTGTFRNQWRVKQERTSYPIDQLYVATSNGLHTIGVYGHDGETTTLEPVIEGITNLPGPLNKLLTWAKEGRDGYERGTGNGEMTDKVKAILEAE